MKRLFAIFALAVISLTGCEELPQIVSDGIMLVNEADSNMEFEWEGGRKEIVISAIEDWTAESDSKWCIVTPSKGTYKDTKIIILVDKNKKSEDRTAAVTLKTASTTLEVSVLQQKKPTEDKEPEEDNATPDAGGDDEGNGENTSDDADQPAETFLFMITHQAMNFQMPIIEGGFSGIILWGDGKEEAYSSSVTGHDYIKGDERVVVMQLEGKSEDFKVKFPTLKDVEKIDLSAL